MKRLNVLVFFGLIPLAAGFNPSIAADTGTDSVRAQLEQSLATLDRAGVLGSVLSVTGPGQQPITVHHGFADIERKEALTETHLFQIGSQTKMFTAAAILLLHDRGQLDVDDLVSKYVASVPHPESLRIRHLLLHTGGIGDGIKFFDPPLGRWPDFEVTFENHLFLGRVAGEEFAPGERWSYNNLGYVILGKVAEAASEQPLDRFVREEILEPLTMNETWLGDLEAYPESRMARGYFVEATTGATIETTKPDLSWASSAGDMVSSLGDLRRWAHALLDENNAIGLDLEDFSRQAVAVPGAGNLVRYGFGMMQRKVGDQVFWGHGGFIQGYVTLTLVEPASGIILQLLSNLTDDSEEVIPALEAVAADALVIAGFASRDPLR
jgi:D-alanyl-D-alanine carboxypeptidase